VTHAGHRRSVQQADRFQQVVVYALEQLRPESIGRRRPISQMNERIAAGESLGELGGIAFEREGLVTHLIALDERSDRPALERRRSKQIHLGSGGHEVRQQVRSDEATTTGDGDPTPA
jgi:hypothetical protein